jgi:hypothetical protein
MNDLINSIEKLSSDEVLAVAQNLVLQITQKATPSEREGELPKPFIDKPNENILEIEQLARLILLTAVSDPENAEGVRSTIEDAGRKELILEGTETVVLATLGFFALNLLAQGKSSEHPTIKIKEDGGKTTVVIEGRVSYEISPSLGQLLKAYFGRE